MSPRIEREAAMDDTADYAVTLSAVLSRHPDPRNPAIRNRPETRAYRSQLLTYWEDRTLCEHLDAADRIEANDEAARRHVGDKHVAEALGMVMENMQDQIKAGKVSAEVAAALEAFFERVDEVAVEAAWADLAGGAQ